MNCAFHIKSIMSFCIIVIAILFFNHDISQANILKDLYQKNITTDYSELVVRDGIHYKKFTQEPFTGQTKGVLEGFIENGVIHGEYEFYRDDGTGKLEPVRQTKVETAFSF